MGQKTHDMAKDETIDQPDDLPDDHVLPLTLPFLRRQAGAIVSPLALASTKSTCKDATVLQETTPDQGALVSQGSLRALI